MYKKDKGLIRIKEELALVYDYIELEKMRFEERLELKTTVDKALVNGIIPTLSIQLLIENAIKHGIDLKVGGGVVHLEIAKIDHHIIITVENPGRITNHKRVGLGIKNLQKRLKIQYGSEASFNLEEKNDGHVAAELRIPIETKV